MKFLIFVPKVVCMNLEFRLLSPKALIQYYHLAFTVPVLLLSSVQSEEDNILKIFFFVLFPDYFNHQFNNLLNMALKICPKDQ